MPEVILTGLRTNSEYHLGNYLGAILPMKRLIDSKLADENPNYQVNLFAPNLHSFTTPIDFDRLYPQTWANLKLMVAAGIPIDHPKVYLYRQSQIPAHSELTWILSNFTGFGELGRMVEFKQKSQKVGSDRISAGLFSYPILMAADILLYDARWVPVGDDQRQHLELTRTLASRFNQQFGQEIFLVPAPIDKQQDFVGHSEPVRIRNLRRPDSKMSKSDDDPAGTIALSDTPDEVAAKIKAAPTDTVGSINYDWDNQPAISNLLSILSHLTGRTIDEVAKDWAGQSSYQSLKQAVVEAVNQSLGEIQANIMAVSDQQLQDHLVRSESELQTVANNKLEAVQRLVGLRQS